MNAYRAQGRKKLTEAKPAGHETDTKRGKSLKLPVNICRNSEHSTGSLALSMAGDVALLEFP